MGKIYDRVTGECHEDNIVGLKPLEFLYHNPFGRLLLWLGVNPVTSGVYGLWMSTPMSKSKIPGFVEKYGIDMTPYEGMRFKSFQDFFVRARENQNVCPDDNRITAPADSKLIAYDIDDSLRVKIKKSEYTIPELLGEKKDFVLPDKYRGGKCLVFRLSMDDYHRYAFIDDGRVVSSKKIRGVLHTVSSLSDDHKIYCRNTRVVNYTNTKNLGESIYIEVGALLVGRICDKKQTEFRRGEEKGYFKIGGSTIVLLTGNNVTIDDDIVQMSRDGIETKVHLGEGIGDIYVEKMENIL